MKHVTALLCALFITTFLVSGGLGQQPSEKVSAIKNKRVNLYHHLGSIEIPNDFAGEVKADWNDAWAGFLNSKDRTLKIVWRAGLIENVREKRKNDIESASAVLLGDTVFEIFVLKEESGKTLVASAGRLEFTSKIATEDQEKRFFAILGTYNKDRCDTCRSLPVKIDN